MKTKLLVKVATCWWYVESFFLIENKYNNFLKKNGITQ